MNFQLTLPAVALLLTSACMGGGTTSSAATRAETINLGTTSATQSASGLPFAEDVEDPEELDLAGTYSVRIARFVTNYDTGESLTIVSEETLTIPVDSEGLEGTLTLGDETLAFVAVPDGEGDFDFEATASNGQTVGLYPNQEGFFVTTLGVFSYSADQMSGFDTEAFSVFGFETNPNAMPETPGTTLYTGGFAGFGNILNQDDEVITQEAFFGGGVELEVAFADQEVDGVIFLDVYEDLDAGTPLYLYDLELDTASIEGNGFGTNAPTVSNCLTCTSDSVIGGAFFGDAAQEIGGIAAIDLIDGSEQDDVRIIGAGSFVLEVDDTM